MLLYQMLLGGSTHSSASGQLVHFSASRKVQLLERHLQTKWGLSNMQPMLPGLKPLVRPPSGWDLEAAAVPPAHWPPPAGLVRPFVLPYQAHLPPFSPGPDYDLSRAAPPCHVVVLRTPAAHPARRARQ
jgi:hypothetical protein